MLDEDKWFYFTGGRSAHSIEGLAEALKGVSDEEFVFHVNGAKNDFANWVEHVFEEHDLADELRRVMEREDTIRVIEQFAHRNFGGSDGPAQDEGAKSVLEQDAPEFTPDAEAEEVNVVEDNHEVRLEEPVIVEHDEEGEVKINVRGEKELSQGDLKDIVEETKHELEIEGRHVEDEDKDKSFAGKLKRVTGYSRLDDSTKFIVKEFIFGFVLGLIFGLIMLGTLLNIRCY